MKCDTEEKWQRWLHAKAAAGNMWVYKISEEKCQNHKGLQAEKGKEEESIRLGGMVVIAWSLALDI